MRPVTASTAPGSLYGRALLAAVVVAFALPATGAAARGDLVDVIVSFESRPGREERQHIKQAGGEIRRSFRLIDAVSARLPAARIAALESRAGVLSVERDHRLRAFDHGPATGNAELEASWGVEHIGAGHVHAAGNTAQGIKVGVIDTGVDCTHVDLDSVCVGGWDFFNDDAQPFDDNGHGTHVAGSLAAERNSPPNGVVGVAPDADLYAYKVLGADGSGDYSGLIAALERATLVDQVEVVNMSLGGNEPSVALQDAVAAAYQAGVVLVAASGNVDPFTGEACPVAFPAAYEQVLATTFTGPDNALTGYSCTGLEVDFAAPGDLINSTVPDDTCMFCAPSGYRADMSGTSMASPHLAGTVALVLSHGITNNGNSSTLADDVKSHLCANTSVGTGVTYFGFWHVPISPDDPRYSEWFGCGVVDANKALLTNPPPTGGSGPNSAPVAADDTATVAEDGSVSIAVLANDTDDDGDALSVASVGSPAHGTAVRDASGNVVYTPAADFAGSDSFTYVVTDGALIDNASVSVTVTPVNDPPTATNDSVSTSEAQPVTVDVLANDADVDGGSLSVQSVTQPSNGTASIASGGVLYSPTPRFSGTDSFTYTISDGQGGSATGTVTVTVSATPRQMHVGDLDASATRQTNRWTAKVTIRIRNSTGGAVSNVAVTGSWSTGETVSCTTGTRGNCSVSRNRIALTRASVTFQVSDATRAGWLYAASANTDPDPDSDGTSIVVYRP